MLNKTVMWNAKKLLPCLALSSLLLPLNLIANPVQALGGKVAGRAPVVSYRLPIYVRPVHYEMAFEPDVQKATFHGKSLVDLEITKPCRKITLNVKDLRITKASIAGGDIAGLPAVVTYERKQERAVLDLEDTIPAGRYKLNLTFEGNLNDKLVGFYRSKYSDHSGKTHYLAVTQMEPTDARRMFPCFDEPDLKATFKITATIDPGQKAISNSPVEKEYVDAAHKKRIVRFAETPKMSTYLVALLIGEFKANEPVVSDGVEIKVWSVERDPKLGNYGRNMAAKILPYLNSYFGIKYPWKKLDLIAIPDFEAGAMENPAAITFRETLLLADEEQISLDARQTLVSVIAHEMAHMWFGDLVTMKWWDDLWLNEAFATWMSVKAVAHVMPEWDFLSQFGSERQGAMRTDALHSSRSIHAPVTNPSDALQMFDEITYSKGASILRMLEMFIGEDTFQKGIHNYLKDHEYGNARTNELWKALSAVSGQPIEAMMDGWANQPGYPLVALSAAGENKFNVSQERFLLDGTTSNESWRVPLRVRMAGDQEIVKLLDQKQSQIDLDGEKILTANSGGYGYYRVAYPEPVLRSIAPQVETKLNGAERLGLLSDQYALAVAGKIKVQDYLNLLSAFKKDSDVVVWETLLRQLSFLDRFVSKAERPQFEAFVRFLLADIHNKLGWEASADERPMLKIIRGQVIGTLGTVGQDKKIIAEARKKFAQYVKKANSVNPDLVDAITSIVAYNGSVADFETIKTLWKKAGNPEVEKRNLFALSVFREPALIERCLNMTLDKEVRTQDQPHLLRSLLHNEEAKFRAWEFMQKNWLTINKLYSTQMVAGLSAGPDTFISEEKYKEIKAFFATHKVEAGESDIARMLERLQINVRFAKGAALDLNKWLKDWKS
ncbi:MAG: M1 family metallopeptidase [Candidatus Obscuribacterales bacterium]|nr:M1 family metallopeptidase [Candidatus Obscuribacterales bacterium]